LTKKPTRKLVVRIAVPAVLDGAMGDTRGKPVAHAIHEE
jgi:hypothetical protein